MKRLCLFCKNFTVNTGDPGYSEETPGYDWGMECYKQKWTLDSYSITTDGYRKIMLTAETCDSFDPIETESEGSL